MEKLERKKFQEEWNATVKESMEQIEKQVEQQKDTQLKMELLIEKETYPPHRHYYIREEETVLSDYIKYMKETYGDLLEDTQEAMNKARRFLGTTEEIENGRRVIYTQKLPEFIDLPDWLVEEEEPIVTELPGTLETYTLVFDAVLCSGKYLTHIERLMWMMIRKRVKNKETHGYWKAPALPTSYKLYADWLGVKRHRVGLTIKKLKGKGVIKLEGEKGKVQKIWLVNLVEWLKERESKPMKRGFIRTVLIPQQVLDAIKKKSKK